MKKLQKFPFWVSQPPLAAVYEFKLINRHYFFRFAKQINTNCQFYYVGQLI
jgi:hypothetical protein